MDAAHPSGHVGRHHYDGVTCVNLPGENGSRDYGAETGQGEDTIDREAKQALGQSVVPRSNIVPRGDIGPCGNIVQVAAERFDSGVVQGRGIDRK